MRSNCMNTNSGQKVKESAAKKLRVIQGPFYFDFICRFTRLGIDILSKAAF